MGSNVEAKAMCIRHLEDMISDPVYTIFHVQRSQIESRTETDNATLYHFKNSLGKVREWNSSTVKDFCSSLPIRFPVLSGFDQLFRELQDLMCKILNDSSESSVYSPLPVEVHESLHGILSACSSVFISHPQWFAVREDSAEYTMCKTSAKSRIQQANVVENTVMNFVKSFPKENVSESSGSSASEDSEGSDDGSVNTKNDPDDSCDSDANREDDENLGVVKVIDMKSGVVESKSAVGEFSTPGHTEDDGEGADDRDDQNDGNENEVPPDTIGDIPGSSPGEDIGEEGRDDAGGMDAGSDSESDSGTISDSVYDSSIDTEGSESSVDESSSGSSLCGSESSSSSSSSSSYSFSDSDSDSTSKSGSSSDSESSAEIETESELGSSDIMSISSMSDSDSGDEDGETVKVPAKVMNTILKIKKKDDERKKRKRGHLCSNPRSD